MSSNSKQNKLIIFDFFGVLSTEVAPKFFLNHFKENFKELKDYYFIPADSGKYSFLETLKRISNVTDVLICSAVYQVEVGKYVGQMENIIKNDIKKQTKLISAGIDLDKIYISTKSNINK